MSETHLTDVTFSDFDLPTELMQGIEEAGFSKCTPIQAETLPVALAARRRLSVSAPPNFRWVQRTSGVSMA